MQEAFLKEENTQAGTEKEPKRSQKKEPKKGAEKKLDVLRRMEENPMITQVKLMEEFNLNKKTGSETDKRFTGRWIDRKTGIQ